MNPAPPRLASFLLRVAADRHDRAFILDDAREEFERIAGTEGGRAARRWYWRQAWSSVRPLAQHRTTAALRAGAPRPRIPVGLSADLSQGVRFIRRQPWTAVTVVVTLTVALAASIAAWSIVHDAVIAPLPFPAADQVVAVRVTGPTIPKSIRSSSRPNFEDWREQAQSFEALAACVTLDYRMLDRGSPRQVQGLRVTNGYDRVLGVQPARGRMFVEADYLPVPRVAVLTHRFWASEFSSNPAAIGQFLRLDDKSYEIVGVLPKLDVDYPLEPHDFWIPLVARQGAFWETARETGWLSVVGRVRTGTTVGAAQAELSTIARASAEQYPANRGKTDAELTPIRNQIIGPVEPMLALLAGALGAVLLIACGNIANLLMASLAQRRREFAVRAAIGAGRWRLARQVLGETTLLCVVASVAGLALSPVLVRAFLALYPGRLPRAVDPTLDGAAVLAAGAFALMAVALLGLPQAWHAARTAVGTGLAGMTRTTAGPGDRALRAVLVTVQVAMSFVLIVAGAAFVRTLDRLTNVDTGYEAGGVLTFTVPPSSSLRSGGAVIQFYDDVVKTIGALPDVTAVGAAVSAPMMTGGWSFGIRPPGAPADILVGVNLTTPGYFEALRIRVIEGRLLTDEEQRAGKGVAVVSEPLAKLLGGRVIGTQFRYSNANWEIVGVVEGIRRTRPRDEPLPELIIPWHMAGPRPQTIVVRTAGDPLAVLPAVMAKVQAIDPTAPLTNATRLEDRVRSAVGLERFRATLLSALAGIAVLLAALGVYSVTAYAVARRTREYGIRLALGERPASIGVRALRTALLPAIVGLLSGVAIALSSAQWIDSFLYGVKGADPMTLSASAAALMLLAVAAGASSARRAATIDPVLTLAQE
jgi:putative ABC transport system permease protein